MNVGDKLGCFTIIEIGLKKRKGRENESASKVRCKCGRESIQINHALKYKKNKYCHLKCPCRCGYIENHPVNNNEKKVNVGDKFGYWTVIENPIYKYKIIRNNINQVQRICKVRCICGSESYIKQDFLIKGRSKSCKCKGASAHYAKDGFKICLKCKENKPVSFYYKDDKRPDKLMIYCKQCQRIKDIKNNYNISNEEFNNILISQNNQCAICENLIILEKGVSYTNKLAIDHNHKTNQVRGILCCRCNLLLGQINDDYSILEKAILYLKHDGIEEGSV